ncbi:ectonucleoside triphosphate diphosphohydrolase 1 [Phakopsora pachyrhizi]|nr:ectonucleoside triphosphate diphosphohydrolase 1 [Phakopsora pachyrhizi]
MLLRSDNQMAHSFETRASRPSSPALPQLNKGKSRSSSAWDWSYGRLYGIVIDAGSSGSRIQIYSWRSSQVESMIRKEAGDPLNVLPRIEKGVPRGSDWQMKVEPGISSFATHPDDVGDYLKPLLDHASKVIPPDQIPLTPIYLLATAGMRLVPQKQQDQILRLACQYARQNYRFRLPDCQKNVRVISGEEEGGFGWIAVNYLMDGFDKHGKDHKLASTYGFLDMGGASTQIAFEPNPVERIRHAENLTKLGLKLLDGTDVIHSVFITTWLGYGTNQARERYSERLLNQYRQSKDQTKKKKKPVKLDHDPEEVPDPCLPTNLTLASSSPSSSDFQLRGTGDFALCMKNLSPLLNKDAPCLDQPCLFDGKHVPPIDFSVNHFIGISEYWYSTHDVWSMGGAYDFVEFEKKAIEYCGRDWADIVKDHKSGKKWPTSVELSRLQSQCFKAAWITNILHEGIGIPRIVDKGGKGDNVGHQLESTKKAQEKGLASTPLPNFQSLNDVGEVSVSWTLGMMVLEVSGTSSEPNVALGQNSTFGSTVYAGPYLDGTRGIHVSQINKDFNSKLNSAASWINPLVLIALIFLGFLLWFSRLCFRINGYIFYRKDRPSGSQGYVLASMEEGEGVSRSLGRMSNNQMLQGSSPRLTSKLFRSNPIVSNSPHTHHQSHSILNRFWPRRLVSDLKTFVWGLNRSPSSSRASKLPSSSPGRNTDDQLARNDDDLNLFIPPVSITTSLSTNGGSPFQPSSRRPSMDDCNRLLLYPQNNATSFGSSSSKKIILEPNSSAILRPHSALSNKNTKERPKQRLSHSYSYQNLLRNPEDFTSQTDPMLSPGFERDHNWERLDDYFNSEKCSEKLDEIGSAAMTTTTTTTTMATVNGVLNINQARIRVPSSSSSSSNSLEMNGMRRNLSNSNVLSPSPSGSQLNLSLLFNSNNGNVNNYGKGRHSD